MSQYLTSTSSLGDSINRVLREVRALARNRNPEEVSWKAVRCAILEAAERLMLETQQSIPVELDSIARLRRIHHVESFNSPDAPEAVLVPVPEGFIIRLPTGRPNVRRRLSIAHEIGHTFFYDLGVSPPVRLVAWGVSGILSQKEEDICKAFARELLMPRELVVAEQRTNNTKRGLPLILHLASRFQVSVEVAAIRLLWDLLELETAVAIFRDVKSPGTHKATIRPRRYFGSRVRHGLRKQEKGLLDVATEAIANGPPFDILDGVAESNSGILNLEWQMISGRHNRGIAAVLNFYR